MKKAICLTLAMVFIASIAMAAGGEVQDIGSWSDPTTGEIFKFVNAKSNDSIRQNQSVIYVFQTTVVKDERTGKFAPKTTMAARDAATSTGIWNGFMQGGFAGLAQGAGLIGGAALLRPSNTNVNNGPGAGASGDGAGATGAGAGGNIVNNNTATSKSVAKQSQSQIQTQTQTQKQKAFGGAGGAGGAGGSVNVTGGIGNSTISAKGKAVVQTGNGIVTTGNNSPATQF